METFYAKLYYFIGLASLEMNPTQTKIAWNLAIDIYPDSGLLFISIIILRM